MNQILSMIHIDKKDNSVIRINFDAVIQLLNRYDIFVPVKHFELTFSKVIEERLVGKIQANDVAKWAIAQALLNTAFLLAISKEELIKLKLKENTINIDRKK